MQNKTQIRSEQEVLGKLKGEEQRISSCMIQHECMGEAGCPHGKDPINCYKDLETTRNSIELIQNTITSSGGEAWTSEGTRSNSRGRRI